MKKKTADRVKGILQDEFEISNRKLSIAEAKRNVNHAIKIYNQKNIGLAVFDTYSKINFLILITCKV